MAIVEAHKLARYILNIATTTTIIMGQRSPDLRWIVCTPSRCTVFVDEIYFNALPHNTNKKNADYLAMDFTLSTKPNTGYHYKSIIRNGNHRWLTCTFR